MKLYLLLFAFLNAINLVAQTLTPKQEQTIRGLISKHYYDEGFNVQLNLGESSFCVIGNDTFFNPPGFRYIFKLSGDTLVRLDKSKFHGSNFNRYLFEHKHKLYLLGGYGMYITHNNLEIFDPITNRWSIASTKGNKPPFVLGLALKKDIYVYSFYNYKSGNNVEPDLFDNHIYKLNLDNLTWECYDNINIDVKLPIGGTYTQDFIVGGPGNQVIIINKSTLEYIVLGKEDINLGMLVGKYRINKNEIITDRGIINLNTIWKENENLAVPFILEPLWYQIPRIQHLLIVIISLIFLGLLVVFVYKRINKRRILFQTQDSLAIEYSNPIIEKILKYEKSILDIDELDVLLEISHLEFDSRKLKRHRILSDLEKTNPGLILRQKDETDKRRFIYILVKHNTNIS
jgi:hypothetical protein